MESLRQDVFDYVKKKYKSKIEYLWKRYPDYAVFRHDDNQKWYGIVMNVSRDKLGLSGTDVVDVLNVKLDDLMYRDILLQQEGILPGYHISRGNWISILLDGTVSFEQICDLIDTGYEVTASAKKKQKIRPAKDWIIPANPKYYDIEHAFDDTDLIEWKQGSGIRAGDTVYMYVAAPVSAILYKCKVTETDIPYQYQDNNLTIKALMKIKLLKRYKPDKFTFDVLKEKYGIYAIRGPRSAPNSLAAALK
ncbi:MmcQ/YjbR family DNA-binding protein [Butyrivibrio sp. INlla16]|uniref:MmcQ/YjbR family DNA-binding protein n=1 Tax=Butyrivibrio sp. INlla16 TaxID=1520807 RepID=UPI00087F2BE0|nr:MmcQ/YjbR family DNA-binding protein [Butyrivibrio sp. INlla16]SDB50028.1 Predicted DNA-binding protein, MmcQ/YjbR family [Butyrivibrio sp. INlla16]